MVIKGTGELRVRDQNSSKRGMYKIVMWLHADRALWCLFVMGGPLSLSAGPWSTAR